MPSGATATLTAGLFAADPGRDKVSLNVRVSSSTPDPHPGDNTASDRQRIHKADVPPPPTKKQRQHARGSGEATEVTLHARRENPWIQVNRKYNLWVRGTNVVYDVPDYASGDLQGAYSATMWSWEGGHSRVVRFEMKNELVKYEYGLGLGENLSKTGKCPVADDGRNSSCHFSKQWIIEASDADAHMRGTWKFIRAGLSRNVKVRLNIR